MSTADRTNRRDSWWRTAPALLVAVLALVVATAGASYAVAANSIGNAQLKSNAVTSGKIAYGGVQSSDVKNGTLTRGDFKAGQLAPFPGGSNKVYFAKVVSGALTGHSPQVTAVRPAFAGIYDLDVTFDVARCSTTATATGTRLVTAYGFGKIVTVATYFIGAGGPSLSPGDFTLTIVC